MSKVLIVDDGPDTLSLLALALSRRGHRVTGASNGFDALKEFEACLSKPECRYDAVVIDYAMPGMDGLTCATRIRELERDRGVGPARLIFYTGHPDLDVNASVKEGLGTYATFYKPESLELLDAVGDVQPARSGEYRRGHGMVG